MENKKTKNLMKGVSAAILSISLSGCGIGSASLPPQPENTDCADWEFDYDLGVWECDDYDSPYFGHFFYGGKLYGNKGLLTKSTAYQSYRSSSAFIGGKSGFGSGSRGGFGG